MRKHTFTLPKQVSKYNKRLKLGKVRVQYCVDQRYSTRGPWAACGPFGMSMRPVMVIPIKIYGIIGTYMESTCRIYAANMPYSGFYVYICG